MLIRLTKPVSIEEVKDYLTDEYPGYMCEFSKKCNKLFFKISKRYGITIKMSDENTITLYSETLGFWSYVIPEILLVFYAPKGRIFEKEFENRLKQKFY